jgi:uncharacterized SAM-binding protein YcdF (DUF218 family)
MSTTGGNSNSAAALGVIRATGPTAREAFCAVLANGPLLLPDAVVLLAGEDALPRMDTAAYLLKNGAGAVLLVTGGRHDGKRWWGAERLTPKLIGKGVSHRKIEIDNEAQNTREQAVNAVALAVEKGWKRLMVVASSYHLPRAYLTFLQALRERDLDRVVHLVPVPASHTPWFSAPDAMEESRVELLATEYAKIDQYAEHVASYEDGLAYLQWWEEHSPEAA